MENLEKRKRQIRFDEIKSTVRKVEAVIELAVLAAVYYGIFKFGYCTSDTPLLQGNSKYFLIIIYVLLNFILFHYCDGFKFGHIKLSDVTISQWISVFIANFVTYFQICLIFNGMVTPMPMTSPRKPPRPQIFFASSASSHTIFSVLRIAASQ